MTTLISFLGKQSKGYNTISYQFSDGEIINNQKYMGLTLYEKIKPKRMILLGTSGSMWDVFLEDNSLGLDNEWLQLAEAASHDGVTEQMLEPFSEYLTHKLDIPVECLLISTARTDAEQVSILSKLADILHDKEQVILDITHSFRHIPLIAIVAARFLKVTKQIDVKQIFYGNFILHAEVHPVLELKGLLHMLDWVDGLNTFDKDGDYSQFADLLTKEGMDSSQTKLLKQSAFFERNNNTSQARQKLITVINTIEEFDSPIFRLFKPQLLKRLNWFKRSNRGLQEQQLAKDYLERHDYLRAVIFAQEGMISLKTIEAGQDVNAYADREEQRQTLREQNASFSLFNNIRNGLVHGLGRDANSDLKRIISDEDKMQQSLKERFKHLFDRF